MRVQAVRDITVKLMLSKNPVTMSRGFSLIELLVVITIIAVLSTVGLIAYSSVAKQGRDSKRQSDLRSIQSALEQYFADQLYYPSTAGMDALLNSGGPFTNGGSKVWMNSVPQDPQGTNRYRYESFPPSCTNNCSSYCLYAKLEGSSPGKPAVCTSYAAYNFAVTPP